MSTLAAARPSRIRAALRAAGHSVTAHLATENGWLWAYGLGYPCVGPPWPPAEGDRSRLADTSGRGDAEQP